MRDLSKDTSLLSINTATVKQWSLEQVIEGCARHRIGGISPWRDKLQECGVDKAAKLIRTHGLRVSGLCRGGFFTTDDTKAALDDNRRAVDEAATLNAACLVLVVGGLLPGSKDMGAARARVRDGIAELLPYARKAGVKLAIEPLHPMTAADRACVNTLRHANDLCDELGDGLGVAVDCYHVWWDPELEQQIKRAGKRVFAFHVCDWLVPTTDLLLDRGMMGDGVIDLKRIRSWVEATGFAGQVEAEIFSANNWWKKPGDEVLKTCIARYQTVV